MFVCTSHGCHRPHLVLVVSSKVLKQCQHPNIVQLYGYAFGKQQAFLVFELLERGSLADLLMDDAGRSKLSGFQRVGIMFDVVRALHFLHGGGASGYRFFHRDIKAANICLTSDCTGKLIDCGLAKLVEDSIGGAQGSIGPSLLQSSGGALMFGTPGYICPWYTRGNKMYEPACDVYSFGIVMLELLTGCLQFNQSKDKAFDDLTERYEDEADALKMDVDGQAGQTWAVALDDLVKLALGCVKQKPKQRPTTEKILEQLSSVLAMMRGHRISATDASSNPPPSGKAHRCSVCNRAMQNGVRCSNRHFVDHECMEHHTVKHLTNNPNKHQISCPIDGCSCHGFSKEVLYRVVSPGTFVMMVQLQLGMDSHMDSIVSLVQKVLDNQCEGKERDAEMLSVLGQINDRTRTMEGQLIRYTRALGMLGTGRTLPCPQLVWIIPAEGGSADGRRWFPRVNGAIKKKIKMYFVCQHSYTVVEPALDFEVRRDWVQKVAPVLKMSLILLRAALGAGQLATGLPYPVAAPFRTIHNQLDAFSDFVNDVIDSEECKALEGISENLKEGHALDEHQRNKLATFTGSAYATLAEKATKDKRSAWMTKMTPVLDETGGEMRYIKNEYVADYEAANWSNQRQNQTSG